MIRVIYVDEIEIANKKVILRCDFNVPMDNGKISDSSRIVKSLKTIEYLLSKNFKNCCWRII